MKLSSIRTIPLFLTTAILVVASPALFAHGDEPHGNHDAHHGGFVMMYEDIHFEVAAAPAGGIQVYYTNAARVELPAATASDVVVEIIRPGKATEYVTMAISDSGDFWEGSSTPVSEADAIVRVGFIYENSPLMLDVPATALISEPEAATAMTAGDHAGH
ncbi:MAG: hypothetical protein ACO3PV_03385 [Pseudohongiellaceae bacterium]